MLNIKSVCRSSLQLHLSYVVRDLICPRFSRNTPGCTSCKGLYPSVPQSSVCDAKCPGFSQSHKCLAFLSKLNCQGRRERVRAPVKNFFSGLPGRADRLKIFTQNRKDRYSITEFLGRGLKG